MASRRVRRAPVQAQTQAPTQEQIQVKRESLPNSYANSVTDFGTNGDDAMDHSQFHPSHPSSKAGRANRSNARKSRADAIMRIPFIIPYHLISYHADFAISQLRLVSVP